MTGTPGWVRRRRTTEHQERKVANAELYVQALERVATSEAEAEETWTPRRGMQFASEEQS